MEEVVGIIAGVLATMVASASFYAAIVATKYKGRFEALSSSLELMSVANEELRAENGKLRVDVADVKARLDVVQSEVVRNIVNDIAEKTMEAMAEIIAEIKCPYAEASK